MLKLDNLLAYLQEMTNTSIDSWHLQGIEHESLHLSIYSFKIFSSFLVFLNYSKLNISFLLQLQILHQVHETKNSFPASVMSMKCKDAKAQVIYTQRDQRGGTKFLRAPTSFIRLMVAKQALKCCGLNT